MMVQMPQSLVLDNKIGQFIANEASDFYDRIPNFITFSPYTSYFDFYNYSAYDALYSSTTDTYNLDTYSVETLINDAVNSLDKYQYIDYGSSPYGYGSYGGQIFDSYDLYGIYLVW